MKDSTILKKARKLVVSGEFICLAVKEIMYGTGNWPWSNPPLVCWIRGMLDGRATLECWLRDVHGICERGTNDYEATVKVTRLAWLDWMIAYCLKEEAQPASYCEEEEAKC